MVYSDMLPPVWIFQADPSCTISKAGMDPGMNAMDRLFEKQVYIPLGTFNFFTVNALKNAFKC